MCHLKTVELIGRTQLPTRKSNRTRMGMENNTLDYVDKRLMWYGHVTNGPITIYIESAYPLQCHRNAKEKRTSQRILEGRRDADQAMEDGPAGEDS